MVIPGDRHTEVILFISKKASAYASNSSHFQNLVVSKTYPITIRLNLWIYCVCYKIKLKLVVLWNILNLKTIVSKRTIFFAARYLIIINLELVKVYDI